MNQNHTTQAILKTLQHIIYNSLFDYWGESLIPGLLATLLDFRLKILANWSNNIQDMAKKELTHQFKELINFNSMNISTDSIVLNAPENNNFRHNRLYLSIFSMANTSNTTLSPMEELEYYLDPMRTHIADNS
ncbi:9266_t:CDS:2 [Dentiscutata erythropus]|uniref:9266_t:CDS:1 n=1 Tax=Dentiscutata erythropus TaxID=1348616 RepID=A0A9N9CN81_9GLOM|nr:9266_t:CDS:2 [Dentiscutata erythropus]